MLTKITKRFLTMWTIRSYLLFRIFLEIRFCGFDIVFNSLQFYPHPESEWNCRERLNTQFTRCMVVQINFQIQYFIVSTS